MKPARQKLAVVAKTGDREDPLGRAYDHEIVAALPGELASACAVISVINFLFIGLDWIVFPEVFVPFLISRGIVFAVCAAVAFGTRQRFPRASAWVVTLAAGWLILALVAQDTGVTSSYMPGFVLVLCGIPALLPVRVRELTFLNLLILGGIALLPLMTGRGPSVAEYSLGMLFPIGGAIVGIASAFSRHKHGFAQFKQRRELEHARDELQALDRAKSRFTANIHHELRTPLTLILAPLDTLLDGDDALPEKNRDYLESMRANALRLMRLITNLLDLAKVEDHQMHMQRRPLDLAKLVSAIGAAVGPMAERQDITVVIAPFENLPKVQADPDAIEKVLVNLIGNALKFTPSGGRIEVGAEPHHNGVHLWVKDTGIGIEAEDLERIFDRFAQADGSHTREHEGTGIGLALIRELVSLHDGKLWAQSEGRGCGSSFHVQLPGSTAESTDADAPELGRLGIAAIQAELRGGRRRRSVSASASASVSDQPEVLVADDSEDMRLLVQRVLAPHYRVRTARDGEEALAEVRNRPVDLVITDVMMPRFSGLQLCQALKSDVVTAMIPVILLTARAQRAMRIEGLDAGADDYVVKPFHPSELLARVRSLLRHQAVTERALAGQKRESLGLMAAGIAHDFNNLMSVVLMNARWLQEELPAGPQQDALIDLIGSANNAADLSRAMATYSGSQPISKQRLELPAIVEQSLQLARPSFGRRTQVHMSLDDTPPVDASEEQTRQLVTNLLLNAAEAIGQSAGTVDIHTGRVDLSSESLATAAFCVDPSPGPHAIFEVRDDGGGIAECDMPKIFDPFFSTKFAGRGLGLAAAAGILRSHRAALFVESAPGQGTRVRAAFPLHA